MENASVQFTRIRIIFVFTTLFLIALSVYAFKQVKYLIDTSALVQHTNEITLSLQKVSSGIIDAESNQRGYFLSRDSLLPGRRDMAINAVQLELTRLDSLITDNPQQVKNMIDLRASLDEKLLSMKSVTQRYTVSQITPEFITQITRGVRIMDSVKRQIKHMNETELLLLESRLHDFNRQLYVTPIFTLILILGALLILFASYSRINSELHHSKELQAKLEKEKKFAETILESSNALIITWDAAMQFTSLNQKAREMMTPNGKNIMGKKFTEVYPEAVNSASHTELLTALQGETVVDHLFYSEFSKRYYDMLSQPLKTADGEIYGVIRVATDITESVKAGENLKRVNEELNKTNLDLEMLNKELESFAYISSHDLQEPLRKIQTFASLILDKEYKNLSDDGKDFFRRMQKAAMRMQTLIEDLLTYSRTNTTERNFEMTDLKKMIEEVKEDFKEELEQKHGIIETKELVDVNIIPFQFRQLMHNLIGNALKFSNPLIPPHIIIKCKIEKAISLNNEPEKDYSHISISDNGIGFDPKYSERIFEVFQRLHGRQEYHGTGIGLAIVKKIVENHYGIIKATGQVNKGARFDIYLPV